MILQVKVAKDVAVKARTAAIISLKQVIVNAPPELREELQPLSKMALIARCAGLRPGQVTTVAAASKYTLRAIARRWQQLNTEVMAHEKTLATLTRQAAPDLTDAFPVGPDTAAEILIVAGDNPDRVRSEPAFAKLCGVAPIPASSGMTTRHRLNRGGHRQANAALYRVVIVGLTVGTVLCDVQGLTRFSLFLAEAAPDVEAFADIDRAVLERYLAWLTTSPSVTARKTTPSLRPRRSSGPSASTAGMTPWQPRRCSSPATSRHAHPG